MLMGIQVLGHTAQQISVKQNCGAPMTFEEVYKKYFKFVAGNFMPRYTPTEAEQCAQEVFLLVHQNFHKYDPQYKMSSFLLMFIINVRYEARRSAGAKKRTRARIEDLDGEIMGSVADKHSLTPYLAIDLKYDLENMIQCLRCSKKDRQILKLKLLDQKPNKEIMVAMKKTKKQTQQQIKTAFRLMKDRYGEIA